METKTTQVIQGMAEEKGTSGKVQTELGHFREEGWENKRGRERNQQTRGSMSKMTDGI